MAAPALAKVLLSLLKDKESRKKFSKIMGASLAFGIGIIAFIAMLFLFLITGILGLLVDTAIKDNWNTVRVNIIGAFEVLDGSVSEDVKNRVYEFMPDFSVNLSKAAMSESYSNALLYYDTSEYQQAEQLLNTAAQKLRECDNESDFAALCDGYKIEDFSFSEIQSDSNFCNDTGISNAGNYGAAASELLNKIAAEKLGSCEYTFDEFTVNGKDAKRQTLTVIRDGFVNIVEYCAIGEVELYLPEFIALYQARLYTDTYIDGTDGEKMNDAIEDALDEVGAAENEDELQAAIDSESPSSILSFMQIADLAGILSRSVTDGLVGTTIDETSNGNTGKLTITLEAPSSEEWQEIFDIPAGNESVVEEYQSIIENILTDSGVPEADMYLNLDNFFQDALFIYFQGFFNLPVDSSELHENGIITKYGDWSDLHRIGASAKTFELGVTLDLLQSNTEVKIDLLPSVGSDCFDDVVIYDVWSAELHPQKENNQLYNSDAITIAYYIDIAEFEKYYGFSFPQSEDGVEIETGTATILVEYSCLSECYYDESWIGESILDEVLDGGFVIGKSHDGNARSCDNGNVAVYDYIHHINAAAPHCTVKMEIYDGWLQAEYSPQDEIYTGVSNGNKRINIVNPLFWFKGFRTELDDEALAGLIVR